MDYLFAELLSQREADWTLENTVIIGYTDHYTYTLKDQDKVLELSKVDVPLLVEKTPYFIWAKGIQPAKVEKTVSTLDMLPTIANLFGLDQHKYLGRDAFDPTYEGYAFFSDGSFITNEVVYENGEVTKEFYPNAAEAIDVKELSRTVQYLVQLTNMILETDFYQLV